MRPEQNSLWPGDLSWLSVNRTEPTASNVHPRHLAASTRAWVFNTATADPVPPFNGTVQSLRGPHNQLSVGRPRAATIPPVNVSIETCYRDLLLNVLKGNIASQAVRDQGLLDRPHPLQPLSVEERGVEWHKSVIIELENKHKAQEKSIQIGQNHYTVTSTVPHLLDLLMLISDFWIVRTHSEIGCFLGMLEEAGLLGNSSRIVLTRTHTWMNSRAVEHIEISFSQLIKFMLIAAGREPRCFNFNDVDGEIHHSIYYPDENTSPKCVMVHQGISSLLHAFTGLPQHSFTVSGTLDYQSEVHHYLAIPQYYSENIAEVARHLTRTRYELTTFFPHTMPLHYQWVESPAFLSCLEAMGPLHPDRQNRFAELRHLMQQLGQTSPHLTRDFYCEQAKSCIHQVLQSRFAGELDQPMSYIPSQTMSWEDQEVEFYKWIVHTLRTLAMDSRVRLGTAGFEYVVSSPIVALLNHLIRDLQFLPGVEFVVKVLNQQLENEPALLQPVTLVRTCEGQTRFHRGRDQITLTLAQAIQLILEESSARLYVVHGLSSQPVTHQADSTDHQLVTASCVVSRTIGDIARSFANGEAPTFPVSLEQGLNFVEQFITNCAQNQFLDWWERTFDRFIHQCQLLYPVSKPVKLMWMRSRECQQFLTDLTMRSPNLASSAKALLTLMFQVEPVPLIQDRVVSLSELSETDQKKALTIYKKLAKDVEQSWLKDMAASSALVKTLFSQGGFCRHDLKDLTAEERDSIYKPLRSLLSPFVHNKAIRLAVLKDLVDHFGLYDSSLESTSIESKDSFDDVMRKFLKPHPEAIRIDPNRANLTEDQLRETAQTLLYLKVVDLKLRAASLIQAIRTTDVPRVMPCFVITQDKTSIRAQAYKATLHGNHLKGLERDECNLNQNLLASKGLSILRKEGNSLIANFAVKEMRVLTQIAESSEALVFPRIHLIVNPAIEETEEEFKSLGIDRGVEAAAAQPQKILGRKRTDEVVEEVDLPQMKRIRNSDADQRVSVTSPARRKASGPNANYPLGGAFHPLSGLPEMPSIGAESGVTTGNNPLILVQPALSLGKTQTHKVRLDTYLKQIGLDAVSNLTRQVLREDSKKRYIHQLTPLNLPIVGLVAGVPLNQQIRPFNTLLKPYQRKEVAAMKAFAEKDLSCLLAAEMGLGKSFIIFEWIAQLIASGSKGLSVLLEPVSLIIQMGDELQRAWTESLRTAWLVRSHYSADDPMLNQDIWRCFEQQAAKVNKAKNESKSTEIATLGQILSAMLPTLIERQGLFKDDKFSWYYVMIEHALRNAVNRHLDLLRRIPQWNKALDAQIKKGSLSDVSLKQGKIVWCSPNGSIWDLLKSANQVLSLHPGRDAIDPSQYKLESAQRVTQVSLSDLVVCTTANELKMFLEKKPSSGILVTSIEALQGGNNEQLVAELNLSDIIVDEADKLNDPESCTHKTIARVIEGHKGKRKRCQLVTGTPFQNTVKGAFTLLSLPNPSGSLPATEQIGVSLTLNRALSGLTRFVRSQKGDIASVIQKISVAFAYHAALGETMQTLMRRIHLTDRHVIEDWNGRIPKAKVGEIKGRITAVAQEALKGLEVSLNDKNAETSGHFQFWHSGQRILLDPSLHNLIRNSPEADDLLNRIRNANSESVLEVVNSSPILSTLAETDEIRSVMETNKKILIVVDHLLEADAIKALLETRFSQRGPHVSIFEGKMQTGDRDATVQEFKKTRAGPSVLIISKRSGRFGLNLPEADACIIASPSYNPSEDDQAAARCVRVNSEGQKDIYHLVFDTFLSHHVNVVRQEKRLWEKILLDKELSIHERYHLWLDLVFTILKHQFLNESKGKTTHSLNTDLQNLQQIIDSIKSQTDWGQLQEMLERVRPQVPVVHQSITLSAQEWMVLPVPRIWQGPVLDRMGAYLRQGRSGPTVFHQLDRIQKNHFVDAVRVGVLNEADTERLTNFNSIMQFYRDLNTDMQAADIPMGAYNVQHFRYNEADKAYEQISESNPDAPHAVRLYLKDREIGGVVSPHADLLLRRGGATKERRVTV